MKFLIVEPEIKGHFLSLYVRNIIKSFKNNQIYLLTSKKIINSNILRLLKKDYPDLKILITDELIYSKNKNPLILFFFQFLNLLNVKKKINLLNNNYNFDHIFFTNLDHFDKILCFYKNPFNYCNFSGILVNPRIHQFYRKNKYKIKYLIYKFFFLKLNKNEYLKKIFVNDILFYKFLKKIITIKKISYFNEPVKLEYSKEKIKNIKSNNKIFKILVYGSIRYSKSLDELIFLAKELKTQIKIKVTIAGIQENDVSKILSQKNLKMNGVQNNFKIINKFISPLNEAKLFFNTDIVWCVYKNTPNGSSGVFHLSNIYKKPVATNKNGLIGWYNIKYNLGPILDFTNYKESHDSVKIIHKLYKKKKILMYYCKNQLKLKNTIKKQKKFHQVVKNLMTS
jgi:hypothetical protein